MPNGWRRERLPEIVRSMASRPRHEALRGLVTELLREGFGAAFSELEHERYLVDRPERPLGWLELMLAPMLEVISAPATVFHQAAAFRFS